MPPEKRESTVKDYTIPKQVTQQLAETLCMVPTDPDCKKNTSVSTSKELLERSGMEIPLAIACENTRGLLKSGIHLHVDKRTLENLFLPGIIGFLKRNEAIENYLHGANEVYGSLFEVLSNQLDAPLRMVFGIADYYPEPQKLVNPMALLRIEQEKLAILLENSKIAGTVISCIHKKKQAILGEENLGAALNRLYTELITAYENDSPKEVGDVRLKYHTLLATYKSEIFYDFQGMSMETTRIEHDENKKEELYGNLARTILYSVLEEFQGKPDPMRESFLENSTGFFIEQPTETFIM